jgi:pyruvate/2-oxoglutarate dehydrogenase complex dihydrolipoamide acyltransferase (E2) component
MAHEVTMPKVAMAMNEGTVVQWEVAQGERVEKGAPLLTIETEKVAYDLEAPAAGLLHIITPPGETVPTGELIARLAADEAELATLAAAIPAAAGETKPVEAPAGAPAAAPAQPTTPTQPPAPVAAPMASGGRIKASPLAKKIAAQKNVDLRRVTGTGPGGRIKKRDIEAFEATGGLAFGAGLDTQRPLTERARLPFAGTRRRIAERVMEALLTQAHVSQSTEIDITALRAMRQTFVDREEEFGTRVSLLSFFAKAMAVAARRVPIANARIEGEEIIVYDNVNVGIAVALPGEDEFSSSLIVPVVRNVDAKDLFAVDLEIKDKVARARAGTLTADDLADGTITLSSSAGFAPGWSASTPVLNSGQAMIIQPGTAEDKPVARNGEIVIRSMLPLSLTFDHRILDGEPMGRFYTQLHECLEHPELLLVRQGR